MINFFRNLFCRHKDEYRISTIDIRHCDGYTFDNHITKCKKCWRLLEVFKVTENK